MMYDTFTIHSAPYKESCLLPSDAGYMEFMGLQAIAQMTLPPRMAHYLKERSVADLKAHIDARMPIITVHSAAGEYVAHALLAYPVHDDVVQNLQHYPFNGMEATTAVIQSLYVLPQHRASKLPPILCKKGADPTSLIFNTARQLAVMSGHTRLMAKVAEDNIGSRKTFEKNGFSIQETAWDEKGGYMAHFLACPLYPAASLAATPQSAVSLKKGPQAA